MAEEEKILRQIASKHAWEKIEMERKIIKKSRSITKYYILYYTVRDGENEYIRMALEVQDALRDPDELLDEYLKDFFGEDTKYDEENNCYYSGDGLRAVQEICVKEVSEDEYIILSKYLR